MRLPSSRMDFSMALTLSSFLTIERLLMLTLFPDHGSAAQNSGLNTGEIFTPSPSCLMTSHQSLAVQWVPLREIIILQYSCQHICLCRKFNAL